MVLMQQQQNIDKITDYANLQLKSEVAILKKLAIQKLTNKI